MEKPSQAVSLQRIESVQRLVEQHQLRVPEETLRHTHARAHAVRKRADGGLRAVGEVHGREDLRRAALAKIYIKQRRYGKALEIIRKLNLKYPKKSIYFADQIRFLEKLVINEKTKS